MSLAIVDQPEAVVQERQRISARRDAPDRMELGLGLQVLQQYVKSVQLQPLAEVVEPRVTAGDVQQAIRIEGGAVEPAAED